MPRAFYYLSILFLGCGGSSHGLGVPGECGVFTPCGGAIEGTWKITSYCLAGSVASTSSTCSVTVAMSNIQVSGTLVFASDSTYSTSTVQSGTMNLTYAQSCLTDSNLTCAKISATTKGDAGISLSCASNAAGDCACAEDLNNVASNEKGTYSTSGNSLAMVKTGATKAPDPTEYCVQGNTLTIHSTSATSSGSATLVATRQ